LYNNQSPEVVLNTPFSILKTIGKNENLSVPQFYSEEELNSIYNPVITTNPESEKTDKNVVLIILESFGDENVQSGQTPFLDSLITESLYFKNGDRKSTRLNSSHVKISYAVFCLKKKR